MPSNEGTRITALATHCRSPFKSIAAKRRLTIIDLVASRMLMSHGYLRAVFDVFDKHKCAVDMVSTSEVSVSLTVDSNEQLPELAADLSKLADVTYEGRKALICMVGGNISAGRMGSRPRCLPRRPPHQRAHDLPGRLGNQHELHDRRG